MKPIFAALCLSVLILALSGCTTTRMPAERPEDFSVIYEWENGSLPPPYHYAVSVSVGNRTGGRLTLQLGYSSEAEPPQTETFEISDQQLDDLYRTMVEQGVFSRNWQATDDPPIGGESEWLEVTAADREVRIPAYPEGDANALAAAQVYTTLRGLVPAALWDWVAERQSEYETRE